MLDGLSLPFICAANSHSFVQWFACLKQIIHHPLLIEEEKYLWLWLATQSANNLSCSFNYEQISQAMCKPSRKIHRMLTRLRTMGFLIADIPIHYGELTPPMVKTMRNFQLIVPPKNYFVPNYSKLPIQNILDSGREIPLYNFNH